MNNQTLFQIVQAAGGMHMLYNNDIEQVRAIAQAAFEAGKQAAGVQDVLDMSDSRNWQVGDVVRGNSTGQEYVISRVFPNGDIIMAGGGVVRASHLYTWIRHTTKETAK